MSFFGTVQSFFSRFVFFLGVGGLRFFPPPIDTEFAAIMAEVEHDEREDLAIQPCPGAPFPIVVEPQFSFFFWSSRN